MSSWEPAARLGRGGVVKRILAADKAGITGMVERLAPLVQEGGYIPCPDHCIPPDVPWENFLHYERAMSQIEAWQSPQGVAGRRRKPAPNVLSRVRQFRTVAPPWPRCYHLRARRPPSQRLLPHSRPCMRPSLLVIAASLALATSGCDEPGSVPGTRLRSFAEPFPAPAVAPVEVADVDTWYRRAVASRRAGKSSQAIAAAKSALRLAPDHAQALELLVGLYFARGRYGDVVTLLEPRAAAGQPDGSTYHRLGSAYAAMGRLDEAEAALVRALELDPENIRAHNNLAAVYAQGSNIGKSIEALERVVALDSTYVVALSNLGSSYLENGEYARAEEVLARLLRVDPGHLGGRYHLGVLCNNQGRYEEAAESLERFLAVEERSAAVHFELAKALAGMNRPEEAIGYLERATEIDPAFTDALYRLGQVLARRGERERSGQVLERFRQWRDRAREDPQLWRQITYHRQALATDPDSDRAHHALGRMYAGKGWGPEAIREFRSAVAANPQHLDAWRQLGMLYVKTRRAVDAAEAFEHIVELTPGDAGAWNNLCVAYMVSGRLDEALEAFERALSVAPDDVGLHYNLGNLHRKRGAPRQALAAYRQALSLEPGNTRIRAAVERLGRDLAADAQ